MRGREAGEQGGVIQVVHAHLGREKSHRAMTLAQGSGENSRWDSQGHGFESMHCIHAVHEHVQCMLMRSACAVHEKCTLMRSGCSCRASIGGKANLGREKNHRAMALNAGEVGAAPHGILLALTSKIHEGKAYLGREKNHRAMATATRRATSTCTRSALLAGSWAADVAADVAFATTSSATTWAVSISRHTLRVSGFETRAATQAADGAATEVEDSAAIPLAVV